MIRIKLMQYIQLCRLDKPIGIWLLLWSTLWALWLASNGLPAIKPLFIFVAGVILMRSAGCVMNDFADRKFDPMVARTRHRPLATGAVKPWEALLLAGVLAFLAFQLVLFCNGLTIQLAFVGLLLAIIYPFMKRYTHLPQVVLGAAFAWGIPMAFAEVQGAVWMPQVWLLYAAALVWSVIYDTMYAMADYQDDQRVGIKSTAILFGRFDRLIIAGLQLLFLSLLAVIGFLFELSFYYDAALFVVAGLFLYQQGLIKQREPEHCFKAFLNNHWVGLIIFVGIILGLRAG